MPGGRLPPRLLITSRCLGRRGESGSEQGSRPLNHLAPNWTSLFLTRRTRAGWNSFPARQPAGLPASPHRKTSRRVPPPSVFASAGATRPPGAPAHPRTPGVSPQGERRCIPVSQPYGVCRNPRRR